MSCGALGNSSAARSTGARQRGGVPAEPGRESAGMDPGPDHRAGPTDRGPKHPVDDTVHQHRRQRVAVAFPVGPPLVGEMQRRERDHGAFERLAATQVPLHHPEVVDKPGNLRGRLRSVQAEQRAGVGASHQAAHRCCVFPSTHKTNPTKLGGHERLSNSGGLHHDGFEVSYVPDDGAEHRVRLAHGWFACTAISSRWLR
jgi:hypothetical protein